MRIDVFTLVPHAFAWLTEQRPIAGVLGGELELRQRVARHGELGTTVDPALEPDHRPALGATLR